MKRNITKKFVPIMLAVCITLGMVLGLPVFDGMKSYAADSKLFEDLFNSGTSKWTIPAGSGWMIPSGYQYMQSSSSVAGQSYVLAGDTSWANYTYEANVRLVSGTSGPDAGIAFRVQDENNHYLLAIRNSGIELYKRVSGNYTSLGSANLTIISEKWYHYKVSAIGDSIKVYFDNSVTAALEIKDSTFTSGKIGLRSFYNTFALFGNVVVSSIVESVTFDSDGGSTVASQSVNYNSTAVKPDDPTKTGYTFGGWYKEIACINAWNFSSDTVTADTTLYAKWTENSYTVSFDSNGGSTVASQSVNYNSTAAKPDDPTKTGYTFGGWYKEIACINAWYFISDRVTADTTLYAKWTENSYTVTYNGNGNTSGTAPGDSRASYGSKVNVADNNGSLAKTGCTFAEWNTSPDGTGTNYAAGSSSLNMGNGNLILYAKWAPVNYTVTYNINGGTGTPPADSNIYHYLDTVTTAAFDSGMSNTGKKVVGWNTSPDGTGTDYGANISFKMLAQNVTLYAKWINENYKVIYNGNGNTGGTVPVDTKEDYNTGNTVTILSSSVPVRMGYTLKGWYSDASCSGSPYGTTFTMGASDMTLYAGWEVVQYELSYSSNGGTGGSVPSVSQHTYLERVTVPENSGSLVRTGCTFAGWNTAADGSGNDYAPGGTMIMPAASTTLYAIWTSASQIVEADIDALTDSVVLNGNNDISTIVKKLALPTSGENGSTIVWSTSDSSIIEPDGTVRRPSGQDKNITLTATVINDGVTETKIFNVTVTAMPSTSVDCVSEDKANLEPEYGSSNSSNNVTKNIELPTIGANGSTIVWSSGDSSIIEPDGTVHRPIGQDSAVTLTATITKDGVTETKQISITVKAQPTTAADSISEDKDSLLPVFRGSDSTGYVSDNISLPTSGPNGSTITWSSGNSTLVETDGTINRPVGQDSAVTLTATITKNGVTETKQITIIVKAQPSAPADCIKEDKERTGPEYSSGSSQGSVTSSIKLRTTGPNGSQITWSSSNTSVVSNTGAVSRPQNDTQVTLTATFNKNGASAQTSTFVITVKGTGITSISYNRTTTVAPKLDTIAIIVNGVKEEQAAAVLTTSDGVRSTTIVVLDEKKLEERLNAENMGAVVSIPVTSKFDIVSGELTGQIVKIMEQKAAVLEIKTDSVTYTLPANQINIDYLSQQIGQQVELKDIKVKVTIAQAPQEMVKVVEDVAQKKDYQVVVKPVEFEITCTSGSKIVDTPRFSDYVERTFAIPDYVNPSKITTGVVLNADSTFYHVPTIVTLLDGRYYVKINSLTNSTYSVIYNQEMLADVENHWSKDVVDDMASRLVISGYDKDTFAPDRDITRAEFAAIVVRGLGLRNPEGNIYFNDVTSGAWYYDYLRLATQYGLISGNEDGSFLPDKEITREEAMAITARAMNLTGLKAEEGAGQLLSGYIDSADISGWAKESVAKCISTGVIQGSNGRLTPKEDITRAEAATMISRLLKQSGLI